MKELKVPHLSHHLLPLQTLLWNPVKELKDLKPCYRQHLLFHRVESGEGIERDQRSTQPFHGSAMWNPVKELKGESQIEIYVELLWVESGEGIESRMARGQRVGARACGIR